MKGEPAFLDFQEAKKFIDKQHSCSQVVRTRKHITLSPKYIGQISTGIKENLDSELKFYSPALDGIPIAYSNKFTFVQSAGTIMEDCPYIHFDVVVDYVVFQPKIGSLLQGCVNKLGWDHVGCLVHGLFNASILRPRQIPHTDWEGSKLNGGDEFVFEVVNLCKQSGFLSITGKFTSNSVLHKNGKRKRTDSESVEATRCSDPSVCSDVEKESTPNIEVVTKHKKKKHKHSKCLPVQSPECCDMPDSSSAEKDRLSVGSVDSGIGVNTSEWDQPKKVKKKKKTKDKVETEEDDIIQTVNGGVKGSLNLKGEQVKGSDKVFSGDSCSDVKKEMTVEGDIEHGLQKKKKKHKKHKKDKIVT